MANGAKKQVREKSNELLYVPLLLQHIGDPIIVGHIENALYWYIRKAKRSRCLFYILSLLGIVSGACVPVINCLGIDANLKSVLTSVVAVLGSISISVCSLFNFRESWRRNRVAAERIKREVFGYIEKISKYESIDEEAAKSLLVTRFDQIIADESLLWEESKKEESETAKQES